MTDTPGPELRIGDAERTAAAEELAEHYAQGRLTTEEHHERLDRIWAARTPSDLTSVFGDLPGSAYRAPATYATANRPGVGSDPSGRGRGQRPFPSPAFGRPAVGRPTYAGRARRFRMLPMVVRVALAVLLAVLVIAHLPLLLVALVIWLVLSHNHRSSRGGQRARC